MSFKNITTSVHEQDIRKLAKQIIHYSIVRHNDQYKEFLNNLDESLNNGNKKEIFQLLQDIVILFSKTSKQIISFESIINEIDDTID